VDSKRRSRAGEQALLHADALQLLLPAGLVLAALGEGHLQQGAVGGFFLRRWLLAQASGVRS
jgi:hypothetical protein